MVPPPITTMTVVSVTTQTTAGVKVLVEPVIHQALAGVKVARKRVSMTANVAAAVTQPTPTRRLLRG